MRKVFFQMFVSLDGSFEAPDQQFDWHVTDSEFDNYVSEMLGSIDGILLGRRTYEGFAAYWPTSTDREAEAMNRLPKIVFSRTLNTVDWSNSRVVKENAAAEVAKLKQQAGKDLAIFASSDLTVSLMPHGVIDEYRIFVNPVALGGGKRLFAGLTQRARFKLTKTHAMTSGLVLLTYAPA